MATHLDRTGSLFGGFHTKRRTVIENFQNMLPSAVSCPSLNFLKFHRLLNPFHNRVSMITRLTVSSP